MRIPPFASSAALATAMALAGSASANEEPPEPLELTLTDAVDRALARSEEIQLAREQIEQSEAEITQTRAGALPQVTGSLQYDRTLRSIFDVEGEDAPGIPGGGDLFGDLPFGQDNTWNLALQINQVLYSGGRISSGLDIAERARHASELGLSEREAEIVREVREAYLQALHTRSLVDIAEQAHEVAAEQLELVESFEAGGTASELDVLQARVERDNLEPQVVQARNAERLAELELKRLLNIQIGRRLELRTRMEADEAIEDIARDEVVEAALQRPAVRAARERVRMRETAIDIAHSSRIPSVSAFANFSWQSFPDRVFPTGLPGGSEWREDWVVGMQVSIPIFEGMRISGEIDQARSEYRTARLEERQLRQDITMQAEAALSELEAARAQIEARRSTVREAERALELAELRYEEGMARVVELSNARLLLEQARVNEAEARVNYLSALATVEYVTGGDLEVFDGL